MPLTLTIDGTPTPAPLGATIFNCAERASIHIPTSCLKNGKCKECVVEIAEGSSYLSEPTPFERHLTGNFRLSCQAAIASSEGRIQCHTMRRGHMRIERHALGLPGSGRPMELDPAVTRQAGRILIDGQEIDRSTGPIHGIAMDLGTTTVVLRLLDLETGELIADTSFENPQRFAGSDVMARIQYDTAHPGKLLRRTLAGYLTRAIQEFPVAPASIYEMVVVGNSTMRDLFFRQSVYSIGQSPYRSITELEMAEGKRPSTALTETGRRCLLPIHPKARVYGAPIISGHVGADAAAAMLAIDLAHEDRIVALMDIGTNTELILGNRHRILAASCPAGPAFEGGAIACGMPALDGAIEDVRLSEWGGPGYPPPSWVRLPSSRFLTVIGGGAPQGICGSGLVALLSELLRTGRMNERGRFEDDIHRIDLAPGIYFLESDVNELAQAKGANISGLRVVFANYGIEFDQAAVFYLAGGFGRHLDSSAAARIGLIPRIPEDRIVQIGNAAIEGATIALLSQSKRRELERLVRTVEHCRLETHPQFFDFFVDGCQFHPLESTSEAPV